MERKINIFLLVLVILVFLLSYSKVPFIFFQQDEILGLGGFIRDGSAKIFNGLTSTGIKHFVPVTMSISYFTYLLFGLRFWVYNLLGLLFHLTNGVLVYLLARRLLKKKSSAIVATLVFFSSSAATQLIMWPIINLNSIALTFSLITWIIAEDDNVLPRVRGFLRGIMVSLFFLMALFSVEYSAGLIFFIPLVLLFKNGVKIEKNKTILTPFIISIIGYLFLRFTPILHSPSQVVDLQTKTPLLIKLYNLVTGYFGQLFFDHSSFIFLIKEAFKLLGLADLVTLNLENYVFPAITKLLGLVLIISSFFGYYIFVKKNISLARNFLLPVLFIIFSSLPFIFVPGGANLSSSISSRYLYFGLSGMAILTAFLFDAFAFSPKKIISASICIPIFLLVFVGTTENFVRGNYLYNQGVLRLRILNEVRALYPVLPRKVVFYFKSDTSYYGLPDNERTLPFQSGLGQTLLVYYSQTEKFPKIFYPGQYLWDIASEGYMESGGRGFGFFRNFEQLKNTVNQYTIPKESIISFSWSGVTNQLEDTTAQTRKLFTK